MKIEFNSDMLIKLRESIGIKVSDLSRSTKISHHHIKRLESGNCKCPKIDTIYILAFYFNVPMETFCKSESSEINTLTRASKNEE